MTDGPTNEEREALIAGDQAGTLEPDAAAELALMADLLATLRRGSNRMPGSRMRSCGQSWGTSPT